MSMYLGVIVVLSITALAVLACAVVVWLLPGGSPPVRQDGALDQPKKN